MEDSKEIIRQTGKEDIYAYSITDINFGEFKVLNSANAWWVDKTKVDNLIRAFKYNMTIEEARVQAGITKRQYDYFVELHPDFCDVIDACRELPNITARTTIVNNLDKVETAKWYAERSHRLRGEFAPTNKLEVSGSIENTLSITTPAMLAIKDKYEKDLFDSTAKEWEKQEIKIEQKVEEVKSKENEKSN